MAGYTSRALANPLSRQLRPFAPIFVVYVLATWFTDAFFMGDTWIYVSDLLKAQSFGASFRDFGHALWLPLGWLVCGALSPLLLLGVGDDARARVTLSLLGINWVVAAAPYTPTDLRNDPGRWQITSWRRGPTDWATAAGGRSCCLSSGGSPIAIGRPKSGLV